MFNKLLESIDLKHLDPVFKGGMRLVFIHPENPDLLIKVIDPNAKKIRYGKDVAFYKRPRRHGHYVNYFREVSEYIAIWNLEERAPHFLQKIIGFVETNEGLGLIVEAAFDENGNYAPTLAYLIKNELMNDEIFEKLIEFLGYLKNSSVIISDLHPKNIVYAFKPEIGFYFVMIDGIGCSTLIPIKAIFGFLNKRSKNRKIKRMMEKSCKRENQRLPKL
jgi:hypothetical protein